MNDSPKHTPGPWIGAGPSWGGPLPWYTNCIVTDWEDEDKSVAVICSFPFLHQDKENEANARLIAAAPEMLEALKIGRRAIGEHNAPSDCYATGPLTGNHYADLVQCPACLFIHMYDAAIAKAEGRQP